MDKFILLAHWNGRFGNRLHQYAYGAYFLKLNNYQFYLPSDWEGTKIFKNQYHQVIDNEDIRYSINQTMKEYDNIEHRTKSIQKFYPNAIRVLPDSQDLDSKPYEAKSDHLFLDSICAYNAKIFEPMSKKELRKIFEFNDEVKKLDIYKKYEDIQNTYDIAHLRRDDVANAELNKNPSHDIGYSVLSLDSYYKAFKKFGYDKDKIEWVSDDFINKWHKDRKPTQRAGWSYPIGSHSAGGVMFDWLEDFLKLYFARSIFRANSSFSFWAACLSPHAKIYSPRLHKRLIYGRDGLRELDVEFEEGNHPHWMSGWNDIRIKD